MGIEDWYEEQRPGLGHKFREMADAVIARIADNPLHTPSGTDAPAVLSFGDFPMSFGTERSKML